MVFRVDKGKKFDNRGGNAAKESNSTYVLQDESDVEDDNNETTHFMADPINPINSEGASTSGLIGDHY